MAAGAALKEFCSIIASHLYGQHVSTSSWSVARCFEWLGTVKDIPTYRSKITNPGGWAQDGTEQEGIYSTAAIVLSSPIVDQKRIAERVAKVGMEDEDLNVLDSVSTNEGWSFWSGAKSIPLPAYQWRNVLSTHLHWALEQVAKGNAPAAYIDHIIKVMVLPTRLEQKLPSFLPPISLGDDNPDNVATLSWRDWYHATGGTEAFSLYALMSREQAAEINQNIQRLDARLQGAEKILRYASLQEPVLRLQEKLQELGEKRAAWSNATKAVTENKGIAASVLSPAELDSFYADVAAVAKVEQELYDKLPVKSLWPGAAPSDLSGLEGTILVVGVTGAVAIGLIGTVSYAISVIDDAIARAKARKTIDKVITALEQARQEAVEMNQRCVLRVQQSEVSDAEKQRLIAKCNENGQATLQSIAQALADTAQSASEIANNKPQGEKENSGLILLGITALAAGYAFLRKDD
ncbi:MAG: hypothetical protein F6K48_02975 [Okeania sp. SIO3H1]|nr:hypothetical protein [Okeania sp. SIO3H1]